MLKNTVKPALDDHT